MACVTVTTLAVASGIVQDAYKGLTGTALQVGRWMARKQGLAILKNLPTGLQASVVGIDMSPELLAALSLGGSQGIKLGTLALMHTTKWGLGDYYSFDQYLEYLLADVVVPASNSAQEVSRMDGHMHSVDLLVDGQPTRSVRIGSRSQPASCLDTGGTLAVVGYACRSGAFTRGLIAFSLGAQRFWYCENRCGSLEVADVEMCPSVNDAALDVEATNNGSLVFSIDPATLASHTEFDRVFHLIGYEDAGVLQLLGLEKVAGDLCEKFARDFAGRDDGLLSMKFLKKCHGRSRLPSPDFPDDIEARAREAGRALPLPARSYEKTRFQSLASTIDAFVEEVKDRAERRGNVGWQPYDKNATQSFLIQGCIRDAFGQSSIFATFKGFKKSKLNIAVSSGTVAMYFPGLNFTVAFPEGREAIPSPSFMAACPYILDLSLSLPILVDLVPAIAKDRLTEVATALSTELGADPSLALSPLTENVVRAFGTQEKPEHLLSNLMRVTMERHLEAAVGGVLSQLGVDFKGSPDQTCYFDRCRELGWGRPGGSVCEIVVNCRVSIEGCILYSLGYGCFLGTVVPGDQDSEKKCVRLSGELSRNTPKDCVKQKVSLLEGITSEDVSSAPPQLVDVACYIGC